MKKTDKSYISLSFTFLLFLIGTPHKAEHSLQAMKLQEKDVYKEHKKVHRRNPKIKGAYLNKR